MMKKVLSLILVMMLVFAALSTAVMAAVDFDFAETGDNPTFGKTGDCEWSYDKKTETLTISGNGAMEDYKAYSEAPWYDFTCKNIVIASGFDIYGGKAGVTHIGSYAFGNGVVKTVSLSENIETIGKAAFGDNSFLTEIEIPDSVEEIGEFAFYNCFGLKYVTLGKNVRSIGESAFKDDRNIGSLHFPDSLETIGRYAFRGCTSLTKIDIPDGVEVVGEDAFRNCEKLYQLTLGKNVKTIDSEAFSNCNLLKSVTFPDSLEEIGYQAFLNCPMKNATLGKNIKKIGYYGLGYKYEGHPVKIDGFKIYGYGGTAAQTYAESNKFEFIDLSEMLNSASVSVTAPRAGNSPSYSVFLPMNKGYKKTDVSGEGWKSGVKWYNETDQTVMTSADKFSSGKKYTVSIDLTADVGYAFDNPVGGTVNSNNAECERKSDRNIILSCTFTIGGMTMTIKSVAVTGVVEPVAGAKPSYNAEVPVGKGYMIDGASSGNQVNGVTWYDANGKELDPDTAVFQAGKSYKVKVSLAVSTAGYKFSAANTLTGKLTGKINGSNATADVQNSGQNCTVICTFTCSEGGVILGDVDEDGEVTIIDATMIQRHLAGLPTAAYNETAADTDRDGEATIIDATNIQRYIAGLSAPAGIGKPV